MNKEVKITNSSGQFIYLDELSRIELCHKIDMILTGKYTYLRRGDFFKHCMKWTDLRLLRLAAQLNIDFKDIRIHVLKCEPSILDLIGGDTDDIK